MLQSRHPGFTIHMWKVCSDTDPFFVQLLGLNNTADWMPWYELRSGVPCGPYKGEIPDHHSLPKGTIEK